MATAEKKVALSTLKLNEQNPRKISDEAFETLKRSIKRDPQFMRLRPIIVDEKNVIIGGNQRYRALVDLKKKVVPASWVVKAKGLTEEQRKRFVVLDNSPEGMAGYWDFRILELNYDMPTLVDMGFRFPEDVDPNKVWEGMPEWNQKDREFYKQIIVRFLKKKDYDKFAKLIAQTLTEDTKCIWYPPHDFDSMARGQKIVEP
jgi:hypothetical protein